MSDEDVKQAYWRRMRALSLALSVFALGIGVLLPLYAPALNAYKFLRFPLGYFLVANFGVILLAVLVHAFFSRQARCDRDHNMTIQF